MTKKRGKLSLEDEQYILSHKDSSTVAEIAEILNRTEEPVKRFLADKALNKVAAGPANTHTPDFELRARLRGRPYWNEVVRQFTDDEETGELEYFEAMWVEIMKQFREDVMMTEEIDIKQWITLEILMNRSMKERKAQTDEQTRLEKKIEDEYKKPKEERNESLVQSYEMQLGVIRGSIAAFTSEHTKLLKEVQGIRKDLKATRQERIKKIEDGKITWAGLVRQVEEDDERERIGIEAEILSKASDKAHNKLYEYHTFADGVVDIPLLTPEAMEYNDAKEPQRD